MKVDFFNERGLLEMNPSVMKSHSDGLMDVLMLSFALFSRHFAETTSSKRANFHVMMTSNEVSPMIQSLINELQNKKK